VRHFELQSNIVVAEVIAETNRHGQWQCNSSAWPPKMTGARGTIAFTGREGRGLECGGAGLVNDEASLVIMFEPHPGKEQCITRNSVVPDSG
jgi:hypothetical protein